LYILTKEQRIKAFAKLGSALQNPDDYTQASLSAIPFKNPWYTLPNILKQLDAIATNLEEKKLSHWLLPYPDFNTDKSVGLILAGNLPLVGFHDILCTLILGFTAKIKTSSEDAGLTAYILEKLIGIEPRFGEHIHIVEKLTDYDLVIATGSNNSARYFAYYFGQKPHIIRKNRNSLAVLTGQETSDELSLLGNDIFDYFGLGCRSVSKLFVPKGYDFVPFFQAIEEHKTIKDHFKYNNNYDYNKSIYLINRNKHYDNGFLLLKEDTALSSPLAVVHYEEYNDMDEAISKINIEKDNIQCVVSTDKPPIEVPCFPFGQSQCPALDDYADGVDILRFLYNNR